jgi:DNA replication and repair protein RecF
VAPYSYTVRRLTLTCFRCYEKLRIDADPGVLVFTGPNGAGKTNILEAVSLLVPGRGLRGARLGDIGYRSLATSTARYTWAVAARISGPRGSADLGTGFTSNSGDEREKRIVRLDGETMKSQATLAEHMSAQWLSPSMDRLFQDGPAARRRFLDRLVYGWDPAHAGRITAYEQAMRQRLRLLRDGGNSDPVWLTALEATMAEKGAAIAVARRDVVLRLAPFAVADMGPFPGADIGIAGDIEGWLDDGPALAAEDRLSATLARDRRSDAVHGRTNSGPHRSDFLVGHRPKKQPAEDCSTGEQKALLIAIVLANARVRAGEDGGVPVLLLDEVAAHLDEGRREALFDGLLEIGAQAWLTGTDMTTFDGLRGRAQFFRVETAGVNNAN